MKSARLLAGMLAALFALSTVIATSAVAFAQDIEWQRIIGIQVGGNVVGSGTGQVVGGAPWETTRGTVEVDLSSGEARFFVEGLILSVGSFSTLSGLPIGTPAGVTEVKGTLVCNVSGSPNGKGNSVLFDTPAVPLDAQGNAYFRGNLVSVPTSACSTPENDAFLIRIVKPDSFAGFWIAFGAVQSLENND